ncbi:aspartate/methionine/tyrosine aminotransferase [Paenibacillus phyllosphaerae]|uniref:Aminotransferase n=1 Tax=Paenibacillus phyllosphaerae TaxID=274593 RepID=A0A7W5AZG5_9BACL|nr:aminotransferase class I/II-fold pyridoxal phosphate-dependent enzyme [Paenibacillus phyllosphaerae]MBB3111106.1 aspartate/methionine/tyrosine aminotransferase [Paenibacillus phyllosphaerae]
MDLPLFAVEAWMDKFSKQARYNLADTCVDCMTLNELLRLGGENKRNALLEELLHTTLSYGDSLGSYTLRQAAAQQYGRGNADQILMMNGAVSANHLILMAMLNPGDEYPTALGAKVDLIPLRPEDQFIPDLDELRRLIRPDTKLIALNNPNNPTGTLLKQGLLEQIAQIARGVGAYILCDEVCLHIWTEDKLTVPSIYDAYERGIATSSLSKGLSLAGLRIGWIAAPPEVIAACKKAHDYMTISCGVLHETLAEQALNHLPLLLERGRELLRKNVPYLSAWTADSPHVSYIPPEAGTAALLRLELPIPTEDFCKRLLDQTGVLLTPGSCFHMEGYVRIGCAGKPEVLREGLAETRNFLQDIMRHA